MSVSVFGSSVMLSGGASCCRLRLQSLRNAGLSVVCAFSTTEIRFYTFFGPPKGKVL